jgi:arginine decarboxylase
VVAINRRIKSIDKRMPLLAALLSHVQEEYQSYHTPGHKQGLGSLAEWRQLLGEMVFQLDLTELPGLDNLHDAEGIIMEAQRAAADYFGAKETFFLVNGTSAGILAVMLAESHTKSKVVLPRTSHQAVIHGLILSGAEPVYLPVKSDGVLGLPGAVRAADLEKSLATFDEQALVVLLHPNYYGLAGEIRQQVAAARQHNCAVLVDEAHGAHFGTSPLFPLSALRAGADYAAQGAHKVLGSFTQSAYLHCQGENDLGAIRDALRIVQSSSPSYLLMASLDVARCQCEQEEEQWEMAARLAGQLRQRFSQIDGITALGEELLQVPGVVEYDPSRLVINVRELGITGFDAADWLHREWGILVEMADFQNLILILGPATGRDAMEKLYQALSSLARACSVRSPIDKPLFPDPLQLPIPTQVLTPREAYYASYRSVKWDDAMGETAAEVIAPYPPGVPVICPGERIEEEVIDFLREWEMSGGVWPGRSRGSIKIAVGS